MTDFLKDWIMNIITLVMVLVLLEILLPSGKMKKYAGLMTGLILVIAIINPFISLVGKGVDIEDIQLVNADKIDKNEIQESGRVMEKKQMTQITEVYRKKLIEQLEQTAGKEVGTGSVKADVIINEDYTSETFGEIKRVYLYLSYDEDAVSKPVVNIEKVSIGKHAGINGIKGSSEVQVGAELKNRLENRIAGLFEINRDAIVIKREGSR